MNNVNNNQGFTLIELIIAMLICVILIAGIVSAFRSQETNQLTQEQVVEMQQNLRGALEIMSKELRMAGYDPDVKYGAGINRAGAGTATDPLIFSMVAADDGKDNYILNSTNDDNLINPAAGVDEKGELKFIIYSLYDAYGDGDDDLGRKIDGQKEAIAENVSGLTLAYYDGDGNVTADTAAIRSIKITIETQPDVNATNFVGGGTRTLTETIKCRNLGLK